MAEKRQAKRDLWSKKTWFKVYAPEMFDKEGFVAETPAFKGEHVLGRIVELPLTELTGSFKHHKYKIYLKITDVKDDKATTKLNGLELLRDFVSRMVRKRTSRVDLIEDFVSKDGIKARYKLLLITKRRVQTSTKKDIREKMKEVLKEYVRNNNFENVVKGFLNESFHRKMIEEVNKIYPVNYFDIRMLEVLE